jgi:hypothetical protein
VIVLAFVHPSPHSTVLRLSLQKMPRIARRRMATALLTFPQKHNNAGGYYPSPSHTCPYCSKTLKTSVARDRHIILKPYCRERHLYALSNPAPKPRKRKHKKQGSHLSLEGEPAPKQQKTEDDPPPATGPQQPVNLGSEGSQDGSTPAADNEQVCTQPFVEKFPLSTAGTPISNDTKPEPNLLEYMKSCGTLADPKLFNVAKLLMMTVPKGRDRTRHLQSPVVSLLGSVEGIECLPYDHVSTRETLPGRTIERYCWTSTNCPMVLGGTPTRSISAKGYTNAYISSLSGT